MRYQYIIVIIRCRLATLLMAMLAVCGTSSRAIAQVPYDQLLFKGTHNSYACKPDCGLFSCTNDPPNMHHPPNKQIDDFGVWALELDYGIVIKDGIEHAVVGHDGPDDEVTCWGRDLKDFLRLIRQSRSLNYRPVFLYFDKKGWGDRVFNELEVLESDLIQVFGLENIFNQAKLRAFKATHNRPPTIPELVINGKGKILPILLGVHPASDFFFSDGLGPDSINLNADSKDHCTNNEEIQSLIQAGNRIFRLDQYQADWTFEYAVPPNPLVVDSSAPLSPQTLRPEERARHCDCVWIFGACLAALDSESKVNQQGTYRFPYNTVSRAVSRATGKITPTGDADSSRAGHGWTVLIEPGRYPEALTINIPLTLKKSDGAQGIVVIGQ